MFNNTFANFDNLLKIYVLPLGFGNAVKLDGDWSCAGVLGENDHASLDDGAGELVGSVHGEDVGVEVNHFQGIDALVEEPFMLVWNLFDGVGFVLSYEVFNLIDVKQHSFIYALKKSKNALDY